jgi:hypothetical protein
MLFKSCPRCEGDMLLEELPGEAELVCLQCGHRAYPEAQLPQSEAPVRVVKKAA